MINRDELWGQSLQNSVKVKISLYGHVYAHIVRNIRLITILCIIDLLQGTLQTIYLTLWSHSIYETTMIRGNSGDVNTYTNNICMVTGTPQTINLTLWSHSIYETTMIRGNSGDVNTYTNNIFMVAGTLQTIYLTLGSHSIYETTMYKHRY